MRKPLHCVIVTALLLICGFSGDLLAQNGDEDDQEHRFSYCFATLLGSGVYDLSGRIIQVYRIPLSHSFRDFDDHKYGLRFKVPVTFGFFDFNDTDVAGSDLPENIGTVTIVPAVEVPVRLLPNWYLAPKVGFGAGKDFAGGGLTYIYQITLKSVASFQRSRFDTTLWNDLTYIGHTVPGEDPNEDLAVFETGVDMRRPLKRTFRGHDLDAGLFIANYLYAEPTEYFLTDDMAFEVKGQYEIGFTIGATNNVKVWRIPLPRIGLSYRFGDGISVVRLVLGNPF